jgi:hypothetical protein
VRLKLPAAVVRALEDDATALGISLGTLVARIVSEGRSAAAAGDSGPSE